MRLAVLLILVTLIMSSSIRALVQNLINENNVMMFAKSYCPYCNKAKDLFKNLQIPFHFIDLDQMTNGTEIQSDLEKLSGQRTVPNIFIKGKHVGGCDKVHQLHAEGKLVPMV